MTATRKRSLRQTALAAGLCAVAIVYLWFSPLFPSDHASAAPSTREGAPISQTLH